MRPPGQRTTSGLGLALLPYGGLHAWFLGNENRLVFFPRPGADSPPARAAGRAGAAHRPRWCAQRLVHPPTDQYRTPDPGASRQRWQPLAPRWPEHDRQLHDLRFGVLALDYRGCGESDGVPSESGLLERVSWAQRLKGTVVEGDSRQPVPAALVQLLAAGRDSVLTSVVTGLQGRFVFPPVASGRYRLRTLRIGFRPGTSEPITLEAEATRDERFAIPAVPVVLWLDRERNLFRRLDHRYSGLWAWVPKGSAGGQLEFDRLSDGQPSLTGWTIRAPGARIESWPEGTRVRDASGRPFFGPDKVVLHGFGGEVDDVHRTDGQVVRRKGGSADSGGAPAIPSEGVQHP